MGAGLMASRPICVRLPDAMIAAMDRWVAESDIGSRTELVETALAAWLHDARRRRIDEQIADGYRRHPVDAEAEEFGRISDRAQADLEPW